MEFRPGKTLYLQVKIATDNPALWGERARVLRPLATAYDEETGLFTLTFPACDVNATLRKLLDLYPEADVLEAGLRETPEPQGYRRVFPGGLSVISPGSGVKPGPEDIVLKSDLSFGSGHHPTTEISIRLLAEAFAQREIRRVFDLGTGSGILALCAWRLGAQTVVAADIDFRACLEACKNIRWNQAERKILMLCGSLEAVRPGSFDLLLANLTIGVITGLAPSFPEVVRPGGLAILSGFTIGQVGEVLRALGRGEILQELSLESWAGLLVRL